jgi:hypothetical protein
LKIESDREEREGGVGRRKKKGRWKTAADRRVPHVGDFKPKTADGDQAGRARVTMGRQAAAWPTRAKGARGRRVGPPLAGRAQG